MRRRFNRTQRNYIIIGLCAILVIMGVGYAAFQSQLRISGTSNISSNWNIQITNIESALPSEMGWDDVNDGYNITEPKYTPSSATFNAGFKLPNSEIDYVVEITNFGNIEGQVTIGNLSCGDNSAIECYAMASDTNPIEDLEAMPNIYFDNGFKDYSDIEFSIKPSEKHYIYVAVYFNDVTEMPENLDTDIKLDLMYEQYKDPNIPVPSGETAIIGGQEVDLVSGGNGLYDDEYEPGRLIYRGQNPNNYIEFNDELWRIIAKESDGTYKIIKKELLSQNSTTILYDERYHRVSSNGNTYCDDSYYGCGVFAAVSGEFSTPSGSKRGEVKEDSTINEYLNGTYYSSLTGTAKNQMTVHTFNIGAVEYLDVSGSDSDSLSKNIAGEKMYTWSGNVGLANVSDILKASLNSSCKSVTNQYNQLMDNATSTCNSNYLLDLPDYTAFWTINAFGSESGSNNVNSSSADAWYAAVYGGLGGLTHGNAAFNIDTTARPVVFLKSDITLSGKGTESDPYTINK